MLYKPHRWVVLKITNQGTSTLYKVLGSWHGGYLYGDSWRINSGIVSAHQNGDYIDFHGNSGSVYSCNPGSYGLTMISSGVVRQMQDLKDPEFAVEVLPKNTDFLNIDYDFVTQ